MSGLSAKDLALKWTPYIAQLPTARQRLFLALPHKEALYGGSAGGGKTSCLLMGALQWVDTPGYSAIVLRKSLADADKPGSVMFRARQWLSRTDARWDDARHTWRFPSGATLTFGALKNESDARSYFSTEFQFIGFDEATLIKNEALVDLVCSRLRKSRCPYHDEAPDLNCESCRTSWALSQVPLRIRHGTNPGGPGHMWVKRRFKIEKHPTLTRNGRPMHIGQDPTKPHIPAFLTDNPYLDQRAYLDQLSQLADPVTREQLLSGDWGVIAEGRIKAGWFGRYKVGHGWTVVGSHTIPDREFETCLIIDPAASKKSLPGHTNTTGSHTVVSAWSIARGQLLLRKIWRHRDEAPATIKLIREALREFPSAGFVGMEYSALSAHFFQILQQAGFAMKAFSPMTGDKVARSVPFATRAEGGTVWLPELRSQWLSDYETELFTWQGEEDDDDDQVDVSAYAGIWATQRAVHSGRNLSSGDAPARVN